LFNKNKNKDTQIIRESDSINENIDIVDNKVNTIISNWDCDTCTTYIENIVPCNSLIKNSGLNSRDQKTKTSRDYQSKVNFN